MSNAVQLSIMSLFNPESLILLAVSTLAGIIIGALPGLTATMGVSLLVSTTLGLGPANALVVMVGVFLGGIYGGSRSAILLNVPGTPSSAATALEGFPLTKQGEGVRAGVMVTTASATGGVIGLCILMLLAHPISKAAMLIGYWEFFWLGMFGIVICGSMSAERPYKGLVSGIAGLLISCIGIDGIYGGSRFAFGVTGLKAGISLVPAMVGLFGLSEAFASLADPESHAIANVKNVTIGDLFGYMKESFGMLRHHLKLVISSAVIGTVIGAIPGTGEDIASWVAYDSARRGGEVEREARRITIHSIDYLGQENGDHMLRIRCSKGTYIRTLCHDLGEYLGCGGCMAALRRTRSGSFSVENARRIGELTRADRDTLLPADTLFSAAASLTLTAAQEKRCRCGNPFRTDAPDGETRFYSENGEFLAIGRVANGEAVTVKSFFEV